MTESTAMAPVPKIIVLGPNWLGDAIMMTPLLDFLKNPENYHGGPVAHITLGIRDTWAPLFKQDPRLDDIVLIDRDGRHGGIKGLLAQSQLMKTGNFHSAILCPPSLRVGLISWLARIPDRIGFASDGRSPLLTKSLRRMGRGQLHYSQEMLVLGKAFCGLEGGFSVLPETSLPGCNAILPAKIGDGPPMWVVAPGTTYGQAKTWPARHVAAFLDSAVKENIIRILLLGDGQTKSFVDTLRNTCTSAWRKELPGPAGIIDLTGQTDLLEVVSLLKSASAFVGNDSGLMHLAGALDVPTVGLFGSSNPKWTAPLGPRTKALAVADFSCQPCYRKTCNQPVFCLDVLTAAEVLEAVNKLLLKGLG